MKPRRADFLRAFLRTFAVQATWNYRTYVAGGLAFAMLPLLRRIHAGDPVALRRSLERQLESFNTHPYLSPLAVGALARMEYEGAATERLTRFRRALETPLGAVGDRLVWGGWRPFCLLVALSAFTLEAGAWTSVFVFLLLYNAGQLYLRARAFQRGWQEGDGAVESLTDPMVQGTIRVLGRSDLVLLGASIVLVVSVLPGVEPSAPLAALAAAVAVVAGYRWSSLGGSIAVGALCAAPLFWIILG